MKTELGYYRITHPIEDLKIPIYGLRPVPEEITSRKYGDPDFGERNCQVEVIFLGEYIWINQDRSLVVLH